MNIESNRISGMMVGDPPQPHPQHQWFPYEPMRYLPLPQPTFMAPDELALLRAENARLHTLVMAQAERIAQQAELLAKRAEVAPP